MSVNDSLLHREERNDDHFLKEDLEPVSAAKDYHVPATNKVNYKPAPPVVPLEILNKTPKVGKKLSCRMSSSNFMNK